jgi:hypothetical protein
MTPATSDSPHDALLSRMRTLHSCSTVCRWRARRALRCMSLHVQQGRGGDRGRGLCLVSDTVPAWRSIAVFGNPDHFHTSARRKENRTAHCAPFGFAMLRLWSDRRIRSEILAGQRHHWTGLDFHVGNVAEQAFKARNEMAPALAFE